MIADAPVASGVAFSEIPVVGILMVLGLFGFLVWDALRFPAWLWFRWLMPVGLIPLMVGVLSGWLWLIMIGAIVMGVGLGLQKNWRQKNSSNWF
ncbi:hypothetical protein NPS70_25530 [Streptomyces sp. C10-9-1]|uniref:hypothetical protein n=1 Tax=Streptomyces sp. C10-9-1 TaxID=1859285 RepID=UPI00211101E8|nr:hypothetical protein [Streptomyces sp. C10-9-1]MCQ6556516.1 hypothetical protein [Streptomyces sp. C10-9-1]